MLDARIAEIHRALVEETEAPARARLHVELARILLRQRRVEDAIRHFREALAFEPTLASARAELTRLGTARPEGARRRDLLGRLFGRG